MGYNPFKMLVQFKIHMKKMGYVKDIEYMVFFNEFCVWYGFTDKTARGWITSMEDKGLLKISNTGFGSVVNFI